ncbi:MAG: glycoside hydrolase family 5 protein [Patescibacteria group bacterium]|nr:glycoside hydrolase family 5 protein [Patescibacteria group bacterium]
MKHRNAVTMFELAVIVVILAAISVVFVGCGGGGGGNGQSPVNPGPNNGSNPNPTPLTPAELFRSWSGANLPWQTYGYDFGTTKDGGHLGYSSNYPSGLDSLKNAKAGTVRLFIFTDLRCGMKFDNNGKLIGFDDYVFKDMDALLKAAKENNLHLIIVLFDYMLADGVKVENGNQVGEHPDLVTNPTNRQALLDIMAGFFQRYAGNSTIAAFDVINEPDLAKAVDPGSMKEFVRLMAEGIHAANSKAVVTVGCRTRNELANWTGVGLDLYQFHYYDKMESETPFDMSAQSLGLDKPILIGECEPTDVSAKMTKAFSNGYAGILFWSMNADNDFRSQLGVYAKWVEGKPTEPVTPTPTPTPNPTPIPVPTPIPEIVTVPIEIHIQNTNSELAVVATVKAWSMKAGTKEAIDQREYTLTAFNEAKGEIKIFSISDTDILVKAYDRGGGLVYKGTRQTDAHYAIPKWIGVNIDCVVFQHSSVTNNCLSHDGTMILKEVEPIGEGNIGVFRKSDNGLIRIIKALPDHVYNDVKALAWSWDDRYIAVMYHSGMLPGAYLYEVETGKRLKNLSVGWGNGDFFHKMVFSADDTAVYFGHYGGVNIEGIGLTDLTAIPVQNEDTQ